MTLQPSDLPSPRFGLARAKRSFATWFRERTGSGTRSLRTALAMARAHQEATIDGILVVAANGEVLSYNRKFLELWEIPETAAAARNDRALLEYAAKKVADWDGFIALVKHLYDHPDEVRTDASPNQNDRKKKAIGR